jgi:hypothetical protein
MLSTQLEQFLKSAQNVEAQLHEERQKTQKIARDYLQTRNTLESAVKQLRETLQSREMQARNLQSMIDAAQQKEKQLENLVYSLRGREDQLLKSIEDYRRADYDIRQQVTHLKSQSEKNFEELTQYKAAWQQVIERDQEARNILSEREKWKQKLEVAESRADQMKKHLDSCIERLERSEKHSEQYQAELQSALIRLQSAEGKFNQLQKEYQLVSQNKKNAEEEIQRFQTQIQERLQWELATQKEKIKAEVEREAAMERERFRELSRKSVQIEIEKVMGSERERTKQIAEDFALLSSEHQKLLKANIEAESRARTAEERAQQIENASHENHLYSQTEMNDLRDKLQTLVAENDGMKLKMRTNFSESDEIKKEKIRLQEALENQIESINEENMKILAEKNLISLQMDELRRQHSKEMLLEKFRVEQDIENLQHRIDELERKGCVIDKFEDELESGSFIYVAEPVAISH